MRGPEHRLMFGNLYHNFVERRRHRRHRRRPARRAEDTELWPEKFHINVQTFAKEIYCTLLSYLHTQPHTLTLSRSRIYMTVDAME